MIRFMSTRTSGHLRSLIKDDDVTHVSLLVCVRHRARREAPNVRVLAAPRERVAAEVEASDNNALLGGMLLHDGARSKRQQPP
jgi:hypothetical protein